MTIIEHKQGYQKTKLGWIPVDWKVKELSNIVQQGRKISYGIVQTGAEVKNGIPCIRVLDLNNGRIKAEKLIRTSEKISDSYKKTIVQKGDLVIALRGRIGELGIITKELEGVNLTRGVALLAINNENSNLYIYQQLSSPKGKVMLERKLSGSALKELSIGILRKVNVCLPPLPEQKKIAKILSTWDTAISKTKALIQKKQALKKGLMQVLLTGKVRFGEFVGEEGVKKSKLGLIPKDWEVKELGLLGEFLKGKGITKKELVQEGKPCIRYGEIYTKHHYFIKDFYSFINESTAENSVRIYKNDLLFAGSGETLVDIGKCVAFIDDKEVYAGGDIIIFREHNQDTKFLGFLLNEDIVNRQTFKLGQGNAVVHIYSRNMKQLKILLPSLPEQKKIAKVLSTCDQAIEKLNEQLQQLQAQKKGLF